MLVTGCCVYLTAPGHGQPLSYFSVFDVVTLSHSFLLGVSHILLAMVYNFKIICQIQQKITQPNVRGGGFTLSLGLQTKSHHNVFHMFPDVYSLP